MTLRRLFERILGPDSPVAVELPDGSVVGPPGSPARLVVRSPDAIRRLLTAPGELGFARAYVAGELDVEGDVYEALALADRLSSHLGPGDWLAAARVAGLAGLRPLPPPPEEARLRGRRHSPARDAAAVRHHYDVSNRFYRHVLGPSLTYSCAVFPDPDATLEEAQQAKHELVCAKLGLCEGMRLLDVGCGWGSLLLHAAERHGVSGVGVTVSPPQAELARERVGEAGLADRVEIRLADYRELAGERFDAVASIGMFEHVGRSRLGLYFRRLRELLSPGGRLLNHGISRPPGHRRRFGRRGFVDRYVFPDGELHEVGAVVSAIQEAGFEARHAESLREHYALTLRRWVGNLEDAWDEAVAEAGGARARIWRLYMAGSALRFEAGALQVHQILAVRPDGGCSGMALRPGTWERQPVSSR
ncbi:MAG TPA: class I SAM-dependent methyltransferase [Gaiellaceae bacterium]|nr:class I SAM-dependent methyltransferase [Gaiellaceae bacterium]